MGIHRDSDVGAGGIAVEDQPGRSGGGFSAQTQVEGLLIVRTGVKLVDEDADDLRKHRVAFDSIGNSLGVCGLDERVDEDAEKSLGLADWHDLRAYRTDCRSLLGGDLWISCAPLQCAAN